MSANLFMTSSRDELHGRVADHLEGIPQGVQRTLIVPSSSDVDAWRMYFAEERPSLAFNMKTMTFVDYIDEKWGLFGDGTAICRGVLSHMAMLKALMAQPVQSPGGGRGKTLPATPGTVDILCRVAEQGMGMPEFDKLLDEAMRGESEMDAAWLVFGYYRTILRSKRLVERGEALNRLADVLPPSPVEVVAGFSSFTAAQVAFLEKRGASVFLETGGNEAAFAKVEALARMFETYPERTPGAEAGSAGPEAPDDGRSAELQALCDRIYSPGEAIEPTGSVRFAFSTGVKVQPQLVADLVRGLVEEGIDPAGIYVVDDALGCGMECQRRLWQEGISSCGRLSEDLAQTSFGKAFMGLMGEDVYGAIDFVLSPYSGISKERGRMLADKWLRTANIDWQLVFSDIQDQGAYPAKVVDAISRVDPDYQVMADAMVAAYESRMRNGYDGDPGDLLALKSARNAAAKVVQIMEFGHRLGLEDPQCMKMFRLENCGSRYQVLAPGAGEGECVEFGSLAAAGAKMHDALVIPGLTSEDFAVARSEDICVSLLEEAGIAQDDDYLASRRYDFHRAVSSVRKVLVLQRPLANADGDDQRPSVLMEELTDCYRADIDDFESVDRSTALPSELIDAAGRISGLVTVQDEHDLRDVTAKPGYADMAPAIVHEGGHGLEFPVEISPEDVMELSDQTAAKIAQLAMGTPDNPRIFSPTFVEAYLECPYKWFVDKILSPEEPAAGLDPIARGQFIHGVLDLAYRTVSNDGMRPERVDSMKDGHIASLVDNCAAEYVAQAVKDDPGSIYAALSEVDKREIDGWKRQCCELLEDDRNFLKGFVPSLFEQRFGRGNTFSYAGRDFMGIIDRVDIDDSGRAVVVDYKGSLGKAYKLPSDTEIAAAEDAWMADVPLPVKRGLPGKVQALIYATAAERALGLEVVGTVYRSYSKRQTLCAVYDHSVLGPEHLFRGSDGGYSTGLSNDSLHDLLRRTEETVAEAIEGMARGDIRPNPSSKDVCEFCDAANCPRRG